MTGSFRWPKPRHRNTTLPIAVNSDPAISTQWHSEVDHFDIVVLGHVCRTEGEAGARSLITRAFAALKPGGTLILADYFVDVERKFNPHAVIMGTTMMASTERGLCFTHQQFSEWILLAGFGQLRLVEPISFSRFRGGETVELSLLDRPARRQVDLTDDLVSVIVGFGVGEGAARALSGSPRDRGTMRCNRRIRSRSALATARSHRVVRPSREYAQRSRLR